MPKILPRRVRDSSSRRDMLTYLRIATTYPELVEECVAKSDAESLRGFSRWLHDRRCKRCFGLLPPEPMTIKGCTPLCQRSLRQGLRGTRRFKQDRSWPMFAQRVERPLKIADVAARLGVTVEEARRRAEADARRGRLLVYRGPDGQIREVGRPSGKPPRSYAEIVRLGWGMQSRGVGRFPVHKGRVVTEGRQPSSSRGCED